MSKFLNYSVIKMIFELILAWNLQILCYFLPNIIFFSVDWIKFYETLNYKCRCNLPGTLHKLTINSVIIIWYEKVLFASYCSVYIFLFIIHTNSNWFLAYYAWWHPLRLHQVYPAGKSTIGRLALCHNLPRLRTIKRRKYGLGGWFCWRSFLLFGLQHARTGKLPGYIQSH